MGPELLTRIVDELAEALRGGRVSKVEQPDERNLVLKILTRGKTKRLLISTDPKFSRLYVTKVRLPNPATPRRFCAFLRSRITGARITSITQTPGERIVAIGLERARGAGTSAMSLVAELTGKSSNIILLDDSGVILDAMRYFRAPFSPRVVSPEVAFEALPPRAMAAPARLLPEKGESATWNEFADDHYAGLMERDSFVAGVRGLRRVIKEAEKKAGRKLKNLYNDRRKAEADAGMAAFGELLVQNLAQIERGASEVRVTDYTKLPPEKVTIPLDKKFGPRENAEKFFKRAKKSKRALSLLAGRIPSVEEELEYINSMMYELENIETEDDLKVLEEELMGAGYIKKASSRPPARKRAGPIRRFVSGDGLLMLCGRSATGNDLVLKEHASPGDIWLHAQGVPGSHVLIKAGGKRTTVAQKTILEAASLAAYHSRAQGSKKAEVIYTDVKNVKKPKGARPGMVTVREYKTVLVEPKEPLPVQEKSDG